MRKDMGSEGSLVSGLSIYPSNTPLTLPPPPNPTPFSHYQQGPA
jgi:hypothetical protein